MGKELTTAFFLSLFDIKIYNFLIIYLSDQVLAYVQTLRGLNSSNNSSFMSEEFIFFFLSYLLWLTY